MRGLALQATLGETFATEAETRGRLHREVRLRDNDHARFARLASKQSTRRMRALSTSALDSRRTRATTSRVLRLARMDLHPASAVISSSACSPATVMSFSSCRAATAAAD